MRDEEKMAFKGIADRWIEKDHRSPRGFDLSTERVLLIYKNARFEITD
jgi:hypothetical protein